MSNLRRRLLLDSPQYNKSEFEFGFDKVPSEVSGDKSYVYSIKGNSQVWNQLVQNGDFSDGATGWVSNAGFTSIVAENGVLTLTSAENVFASNCIYGNVLGTTKGHVYLIRYWANFLDVLPSESVFCGSGGYQGLQTLKSTFTVGQWVLVKGFFTRDVGGSDEIRFYPRLISGGQRVSIKNIQCIDLTLLGIDNLTTVEQVEEWLAENVGTRDYYDYNPGTVLNNKTEQVEAVGFNQWDEEWEIGSIDNNTGQNTESTSIMRSKNYMPAIAGRSYYFAALEESSNRYIIPFFYDVNKQFIGAKTDGVYAPTSTNNPEYGNPFIVPSNTCYVRFKCSPLLGTTYQNNICINISDSTKNGTYEPYYKIIIPLNLTSLKGKLLDSQGQPTGNSVVISPNGLAGKDDWRDYCIIEGGYITKVVKKTGEVDMGTLEWYYDSKAGHERFQYVGLNIKNISSNILGNLLCPKYISATDNAVYGHTSDKLIGTHNGIVQIYDSAYTDAPTFKTAMTGVKLVYELATPQTYLLDIPIPLTNRVDNGGTKRRLPEDTASSVSAPFSCEVAYDTINTNTNSIERVNTTEEFIYDNISIDKPVKRGILTKIKGKSLVWNQLVSYDGNITGNGIRITGNGNGEITIVASSATGYNQVSVANTRSIQGHKYLISGNDKNDGIEFYFGGTTAPASQKYIISLNTKQTLYYYVGPSIADGTYNKKIYCIDLTLMFGAGNEPSTVAEFEKLYSLSYYNYNSGTIINNTVQAIKTTGKNLLGLNNRKLGILPDYSSPTGKKNFSEDEYYNGLAANGYYISNNGCNNVNIGDGTISATNVAGAYGVGFPVRCFPNTEYHINAIGASMSLGFFTYEGVNIGYTHKAEPDGSFMTPVDCFWVVVIFCNNTTGQTISYNNVCFNISDTSFNGQYEHYWKNAVNLNITSLTGKLNGEGNSVTIVPTGLKSAGTVYDYGVIEKGKLTKIVKCIGEVDLGTLSWSYTAGGTRGAYFYTVISEMPDNVTYQANILCSTYVYSRDISSDIDKVISGAAYYNFKQINVKDTTYSDIATFKTAMSGVPLYYKLAEPQIYILDNPVPVSLLTYKDCTVKQIPENTSTVITATNVEVIKNQIH